MAVRVGTAHGGSIRGILAARVGMTVLELVIALSLTGMAVAGIMGMSRTTTRLALIHDGRLDAQQWARRGMERVVEELRWAETVVADPLCAPTDLCRDRIRVRIPAGNPYRQDQSYEVVFRHNPIQREVERTVDHGTNNLAARIERVDFAYLDAQGLPAARPEAVARVQVTLIAAPREGSPVALHSEVALRNWRVPYVVPSPTPTPTPAWRPSPSGFGVPIPIPIDRIAPGPPGPPQPR